eukprot:gnl/TRDRNA2_/TRDRNA2_105850_c0_seq1.p1 gnl/TRDRNA2_/TRDRNA2_105850_c0~~gnl/TRDRNA2_/TRDRNA2_105850_c0_seq1.p1  ORF type:complete len:315 (-),score=110.96 gnl/TRDRNA2_/TRDRNA2_105850_c0_seq1:66-1010(-)
MHVASQISLVLVLLTGSIDCIRLTGSTQTSWPELWSNALKAFKAKLSWPGWKPMEVDKPFEYPIKSFKGFDGQEKVPTKPSAKDSMPQDLNQELEGMLKRAKGELKNLKAEAAAAKKAEEEAKNKAEEAKKKAEEAAKAEEAKKKAEEAKKKAEEAAKAEEAKKKAEEAKKKAEKAYKAQHAEEERAAEATQALHAEVAGAAAHAGPPPTTHNAGPDEFEQEVNKAVHDDDISWTSNWASKANQMEFPIKSFKGHGDQEIQVDEGSDFIDGLPKIPTGDEVPVVKYEPLPTLRVPIYNEPRAYRVVAAAAVGPQ